MAVVTVTLAGKTFASRVGARVLHQVGLDDLVAQTPEQYVAIARALAADTQRLAGLRNTLRATMSRAPLADGTTVARDLEEAFRQIWGRWCE